MNAVAKDEWEDVGNPVPRLSKDISAALAAAQGEFEPVLRDKTVTVTMKSGGKYTFSYAPLESILAAVKPALAKNSLCITQAMVVLDAKAYVETTLRHSTGQTLSNLIPLFVRDDGPQAYGSALTYARRYGVTLLLCISADDDDDANAAEGHSAEVTRERDVAGPPPSELKVKLIASNFQAALKLENDEKIRDVHVEANKDKPAYGAAWKLLGSADRRSIKDALDRMGATNGAAHA